MNRTELLKISKPILFNTEMVKAILDGRKTVTRRVAKQKDNRGIWEPVNNCRNHEYGASVPCYLRREKSVDDCSPNTIYPKIDVGDILYVRETWHKMYRKDDYIYRADNPKLPFGGVTWRPSIHMPKSAARIFLKVTDVRVERLQDITAGQAIKEGVRSECSKCIYYKTSECEECEMQYESYYDFMDTWDNTIKKQDIGKYDWEANPWVWVYEFERVGSNG